MGEDRKAELLTAADLWRKIKWNEPGWEKTERPNS